MSRTTRARTERLRTDALLVRSAPFGEADVMVTLFTEQRGILSAVARSARRSARRFSALEPMHLLRIGVDERPGAEVGWLVESSLLRPRIGLTSDLDKLEVAGTALRWIRRAAPPHTPEPAAWAELNGLLDRLDQPGAEPSPRALLAASGLRLLSAVGWGLDLERCVRCGRVADPGATACVDAAEGGLVCRACGGAKMVLRGALREHLLAALEGDDAPLSPDDVRAALELVDAAVAAHA